MSIERACRITGIRMNELSRINTIALKEVIEAEKTNPEGNYILYSHTKAEYVEAYETILNAVENN